MKITKRQLRRIIKEEVGTNWRKETQKVTGTDSTGSEKNITRDLEVINQLVPKLMSDFTDGIDDEMMTRLYVYVESIRQDLETGKWSQFG
jgi:hypothetical protein